MNLYQSMKPLSLAIGLGVTLCACGGGSYSGSGSEPDPVADAPAAPPAAPEPPANPAQIQAPTETNETDIGLVLRREADGLTLYTFENDRDDSDGDGAGDSDCNGGCAETWPPLLADAGSEPARQFSIITRDDGETLQWAFKGMPLYTFTGDANPADTTGDGSGGVWYVARPDPWRLGEVNSTAVGTIFVGQGSVRNVDGAGGRADDRLDREGFTLYTFEDDRNDSNGDGAGDSDCNDGCAETWPPLFADAGATPGGPFTIIDRDDGSRQWALDGLPLYFFAPDQAPGETNGEAAGRVWYVARPQPITNSETDLSTVLTGATSVRGLDGAGQPTLERAEFAGFSLYVFDGDSVDGDGDGAGDSDCNGGCAQLWPPLFADAGARPTGNFSIISRDDGNRQWALRGDPLYFFIEDLAPGDVTGDERGGVWHLARTAPLQLLSDTSEGTVFTARGIFPDVLDNGEQAETESDKTGFAVYRFEEDRNDQDGDGVGDSDCNGDCASTWPPVFANELDRAAGDFGIITRDDGTLQWTFLGDPLYFFEGDGAPGDVNGRFGPFFPVAPESFAN